MFVADGISEPRAISSMPGVFQHTLDSLSRAAEEAVAAGVDIIMLDNRTPEEIKLFRSWIPQSITVEVSGGITLDTLPAYGECGADYISLGALTHSAPALDLALDFE